MPKVTPPAYGEGSISGPDRNGIRRGRVMVNGERRSVYGRTIKDVKALMAAERERDGAPIERESPTLGEWCTEWFEEFTSDEVTRNTLDNYEWGIDKWAPLHHLTLDELTVPMIQDRLRELGRGPRPLAKNSLIRARTILGMAIDAYNDQFEISWNPARRAKLPKRAKPPAEKRTLTVEQARALLEAARGDRLEVAVVLMLWLGLRPGEAAGLPWAAVDLEAGTVAITQFRRVEYGDDGRAEMSIAQGAKAKSDRPLRLPPEATDALRRQWNRQARDRLKVGPAWIESGLVVTTAAGGPKDPANIRRTVSRLAKAAGISLERPLTPYELRHTAASLYVEAGMPLEVVSDLLGHKTPRMLIEAYRHRSKRTVDEHLEVRLFA
jgi:integrase